MHENNLNWKAYEAITKYIYETLGKEFGVTIEGYGSNCKVQGRSGSFHQIDVLTKQSNGVHQVRTAIECKCLKNKATKGTVMKLLSTINDARIEKGVIVSKSGFTSGAVNFAREYNIGLVELREAQQNDFQEHSKEIHFGDLNLNSKVRITRPQILNIDIGNNQSIEIRDEWDYSNYVVTLENQTKIPLIQYVNEFRNEVNLQNKKGEKITRRYETPNAILFNKKTLASMEINEIIFTGQLIEIDASQSMGIRLVDQVWLLMKSIFEERVFTFSESGLIVERISK